MKKLCRSAVVLAGSLALAGCSVFGDSGVEIAPYKVLVSDGDREIRHYEELVLVSAPMDSDDNADNSAFRVLFRYITGNNAGSKDIAMTAPVFMDRTSGDRRMSFVLPSAYSLENAPAPSDPNVSLSRVTDRTYAVITFSGFLERGNIEEHREKLARWLAARPDYKASGSHLSAGYNPPWTLPMMRRNEVLIPVTRR